MGIQAMALAGSEPVGSGDARYSALFHSAGDAMLLIKGVFVNCNARALALFRATPEQILGLPPEDFNPALQPDGRESRQACQEYSKRASRGEIVKYEWQFRRPDQTTFNASVTLNEISTGSEALQLAIVREDSRAPELERQLESARAELESLTYAVAHDLRAAVSGMAACTRIVLEEYAGPLDDPGKRWLGHIHDDAVKLDRFTASLLELSRVTRVGLNPARIDMSALAVEIGQRLAAAAPERSVDFNAGAGLTAWGDAALVRQLTEKLLENAWKFTGKTAEARVEFGSAESSGTEPVFFVRDNGIGFDMAYSDKLFVPFQRLHTDPDFEGGGVNLATVRRIVHRHGGGVWATGTPGKGATFFFTLGKRSAE